MPQLRVARWLAVSSEAQASKEKASLEEQDRVSIAWCEENNAAIVKTFWWDGHSRSETDVLTAYQDFAEAGRFEYHELRQMWMEKAFDVLWVYVHDRIARSPALYAQVMSNVIKSGARIFSYTDGWIDDGNVDTFLAIGSFSATSDLRKLKLRHHFGMNKVAARGLPTSSRVLASHQLVRDNLGKPVRLEFDKFQRRFWDDVYRLVVDERVPWSQLEERLHALGHTGREGKPLRPSSIRQIISSPTFWGNSARFQSRTHANFKRDWAWVYDATQAVPDGILLHRDTHESVYTGEQRARFIAEIERRRVAGRGRSRPYQSNRYVGLIVCRGCDGYLHYTGSPPYVYLYCRAKHLKGVECDNKTVLRLPDVDAFVAEFIEAIRRGKDIRVLLGLSDHKAEGERRIEQLRKELEAVKNKQRKAADRLLNAPEGSEDIFEEQVAQLASQRLGVQAELDVAERMIAYDDSDQRNAAQEIHDLGENFWLKSDTEINVLLTRVMGGRRISTYKGEVLGWVDAPRVDRRVETRRRRKTK